MKIAIFVETYLPYLNGVVTHVKILKDGLEKQGHEVLIVTADPKARRHYKSKGILHCPAKVSKKIYGYGLSSPVSRVRMKYIEKFNPDIIHIQQEFGIGISGILAAKILKKPLVYTMHTMYDDYLYYIAPKPLIPAAKKLTHAFSKLIAKASTELTGPSKKIEDYFQKVGVTKHVNVIPNSVELDEFNSDNIPAEAKKAVREKYNIGDDKMLICFVGRMGKEKSVDVLLEYWAKTVKTSDNLHLLLIGGGPSEDEFKQLAKDLNIADMVTFTGKVPHPEVPAYYACCDMFISASVSEVNSISMLEAMAAGLPVIQRLDKLNEGQVVEGVNGYLFNSADEMYDILMQIKSLSYDELKVLKKSVVDSVKQSGAEDLANYMLAVYKSAYAENKSK